MLAVETAAKHTLVLSVYIVVVVPQNHACSAACTLDLPFVLPVPQNQSIVHKAGLHTHGDIHTVV